MAKETKDNLFDAAMKAVVQREEERARNAKRTGGILNGATMALLAFSLVLTIINHEWRLGNLVIISMVWLALIWCYQHININQRKTINVLEALNKLEREETRRIFKEAIVRNSKKAAK